MSLPDATKVLKAYPLKIALSTCLLVLFVAIEAWEYYAPLQIHNWNGEAISHLKVSSPSDFTFAVFGDNKGNSSIFDPLLRDIDHTKDIAFAIDVGDLVPSGKGWFYRRFLAQIRENLGIPLLAAIGNHDLDHGSGQFREIFGPTYYSFQIGQSYFIMLDATTELGFDKEERQWLEKELQSSQVSKAHFIFMHVPPFDPRGGGFNKCLPEKDGKDLLDLFKRYTVTHIFASHIHGYFPGEWNGIPYTITGGAGGTLQGSDPKHFFHHYVSVQVHGGKATVTTKRIEVERITAAFFDLIGNYSLEWGLPLGAGILLFAVALSAKRTMQHL